MSVKQNWAEHHERLHFLIQQHSWCFDGRNVTQLAAASWPTEHVSCVTLPLHEQVLRDYAAILLMVEGLDDAKSKRRALAEARAADVKPKGVGSAPSDRLYASPTHIDGLTSFC